MNFSYWQKDAFLHPADVVIAGGGFMGLWSAYELKKKYPKVSITILERESFPGGASVRNAGLVCFGSPGELLADAKTIGEEAMWQMVAMRYQGIAKIRQVLGDEAIDYDVCGGYERFADNEAYTRVTDKLPWLNAGMQQITGIPDVFTTTSTVIQTLGMQNFTHLIANQLEGGLHSGKAIRGLSKLLTAMDVNILNGVEVRGWEDSGQHIAITTGGAFETVIQSSRLLITTNAFTKQLVLTSTVVPARGQLLITKPIQGLKLRGTFHYDRGYYYWRNVGDRILLGGARNQAFNEENTITIAISATIQEALQLFLNRYIEGPVEVDYSWAGIMGFTQNKQPIIEKIAPNVWAAVACNGMGVALTPVMAEKVVAQMMG